MARHYVVIFIMFCIGLFAGGLFMGSKKPIPFIKRDTHKLFGVHEMAQKTIVKTLNSDGIKTYGVFEVGPTRQAVMDDDSQLIIACFPGEIEDLPTNVLSIGVDNPRVSAERMLNNIRNIFHQNSFRFYANMSQPFGENVDFYIIKSNAFLNNTGIAYRPYFNKMPPVEWLDVEKWLKD